MKPLTVYKASAGSGKTFTLAVEYIKLLINNPLSFRNILAVTFTNKATEEMKQRILSQLYGIWKKLPESDIYMNTVCESLDISEEQASRQAGIALNYLVHNYHYFMVETIDSFFQSILRNLARELDLTANLKIGLNDVQVEELAVDQLIESLSATSMMLQWLISYIFSNISENKGWNVIGQIKKFGRTIFRDFYKTVSDDLNATVSQQAFFNEYTDRLSSLRAAAKKRMAAFADTFEQETRLAGLSPTDYAGKKNGICSYFNKLKSDDFSDAHCMNKTLANCLTDAEKWTTKSSPDRDTIMTLVNDKLMNLLRQAEDERSKQWRLYATADCTLRHLDKLRLLAGIESKVRELNAEANRFLLSDTQYLLHTLISDSDSPFVFEKAGCRLDHIMIDEFQDTSSIQWQNFKILMKECMSHAPADGNTVNNLIVGDVKQSIYRWRAGDWRLLNDITTQFEPRKDEIEIRNLQTNYRSERNIIDFNNCFFTAAARLEHDRELDVNSEEAAQELLTAYADVSQTPRPGRETDGLVSVKLLENEDYEDNMLAETDATVTELLDAGALANDIAILIRYNRHIPLIADYLMERHPQLPVVSDEAFRLDSSLAVVTIIRALRILLHPDDLLTKATLAVTYQKYIARTALTDDIMLTGVNGTPERLDSLLPADFVNATESLAHMPLIDAVERIYSVFNLGSLSGQHAYICAFYDSVADFVKSNSGNLAKFLEAWDEDICSKTIQSDETNGIRLVSIHKSKGLEFDHVIIPFCDWALESRDTTLWCRPASAPFNSLPIVPVDYSKKLLETIYAADYCNEHIQNTVDNLNLLYVAFTRASRNLFVLGCKHGSRGGLGCRSDLLAACLPEICPQLESATLTDDEGATTTFVYGSLSIKKHSHAHEEKPSANVFLTPSVPVHVSVETHPVPTTFRQSNRSKDFIVGGTDDERGKYIKTGNVLHKLFSTITTAADIENALSRLEFEGILYDEWTDRDSMLAMLRKRLSSPHATDWFSDRWQVFNECTIMNYDRQSGKVTERRPDRVISDGNEIKVIDFKFGKPNDSYRQQVRQYMQLLKAMGYNNITGWLWYVYSDKVEQVKD